MKKKIIKSAFLVSFALGIFTFTACSNFLSGSTLKDDVQKEVERAKAPSVVILTTVKNSNHGRILPGKEAIYKVGDVIEISYEKDPGYDFVEFEVLNKDTYIPVTGAVSFSPILQKSDGAHKVITTTAKILSSASNLLIRPKCVSLSDTTPPVFSTHTDTDGNEYDFVILSNKGQELVSTPFGDGTAWSTEDYKTNHLNSVNFKFFCADDENEIKNLIVRETLEKNVAGEHVGTLYERIISANELDLQTYSSMDTYAGNFIYEFKSPIDGLIRLDFYLEDIAGNVSNSLKTYHVIKDSTLPDISNVVTFKDGGNNSMTYKSNSPSYFENFNKIPVISEPQIDKWFESFEDTEIITYYVSNDGGRTYKPANISNNSEILLGTGARNNPIHIRAEITDNAGNINTQLFSAVNVSDVPVIAERKTNENGEYYLGLTLNKLKDRNGYKNYIYYYAKPSSGAGGSTRGVIDISTDTIPYKANYDYSFVCFSTYKDNQGNDVLGIPSEVVEFKNDQIATSRKNVSNLINEFRVGNPSLEEGTEPGTYKFYINFNNGGQYKDVYIGFNDKFVRANLDIVGHYLDNIPASYMNKGYKITMYGVKQDTSTSPKKYVLNYKEITTNSTVDTSIDNQPPVILERNFKTDGTLDVSGEYNKYLTVSTTGTELIFSVIDNEKFTNMSQKHPKVYYSSVKNQRTIEEIKELPYLNSEIRDSTIKLDNVIEYNGYYCLTFKAKLAALEETDYVLYINAFDTAGNECIKELNLSLKVNSSAVIQKPASGTKNVSLNGIGNVDDYDITYTKAVWNDNNKSFASKPDFYWTDDSYLENFWKITCCYKKKNDSWKNRIYVYDKYVYLNDTTCKVKGLSAKNDLVYVYADQPVFIETLINENNYSNKPEYWERHTLDSDKLNRKVIKPSNPGTGTIFAYPFDGEGVEEGKYYCVVVYFADGTSLMSEVKKK